MAGRTASHHSFSWMIGGPQGSGINLGAEILAKAFCRGGYQVFGNIEYHSNIKGKHSYYRLRISDQPVRSHVEEVHLLVALDEETLFGDLYHEWPAHAGHIHEVAEGGGLLFEESAQISAPAILERLNGRRVELYAMPYSKIVDQALATVGKAGQAHEYRIMNNTAAIGAATALMGFDFERVAEVILAGFHGKARKVGEMNVYCARAAHNYVREHFKTKLEFSLPAAPARAAEQIMIKGTQAVG
ncbi:MAG: 2-oxoacid:acceptor oxidoreductase family protein, partial [Candidatus Acidiferrales bacterium]